MRFFSANLQSLREVYTASLRKALDMEQTIEKALPTMIEKSCDQTLKNAFTSHLAETKGHVSKVERLLHSTGQNDPLTCKVIHSLVTEAQDMIKDSGDSSVCDVSLIAAGQQVEHHEIAVYGTLKSWATYLGLDDQADVLESILAEEKNADKILSSVSDRVNSTAENPALRTPVTA